MTLPAVIAGIREPSGWILQAVRQILRRDRGRDRRRRDGRGRCRCRAGAAQRREIAEQVLQVSVGQLRGAVVRHQRILFVNHLLQVSLEVALQAFARVHDLDAEHILGLLRAADALAIFGHEGHGLERRRHPFGRRADFARQRRSRACGADAREIGPEPSAGAGHTMAGGALLREELPAVIGVADRRFRCGHAAEISEIRDDLQDVVVGRIQTLRGHFRTRHALSNRVEEPLVGRAAGDEGDQIGTAIAGGIEPVAVAAAHAVGGHASPNRLLVSQVRIIGGGIRRRRSLGEEQAARDERQRAQQ